MALGLQARNYLVFRPIFSIQCRHCFCVLGQMGVFWYVILSVEHLDVFCTLEHSQSFKRSNNQLQEDMDRSFRIVGPIGEIYQVLSRPQELIQPES